MMKRIKWMMWVVILLSSGMAKAQIAPGMLVLRPQLSPTFTISRESFDVTASQYYQLPNKVMALLNPTVWHPTNVTSSYNPYYLSVGGGLGWDNSVPNYGYDLSNTALNYLVIADKIYVSTSDVGDSFKWAAGNQTVSYFTGGGGTAFNPTAGDGILISSATANGNGVYTIYASNATGAIVKTIDVENYRDGKSMARPKLIQTVTDLANVNNALNLNYELYGNLNLRLFGEWTPLGSKVATTFTGTLYGNFYQVQDLKITIYNQGLSGLFGTIGGNGMVSALGVTRANINIPTLNSDGVGIIVGEFNGPGTVSDCYSTGNITANGQYVGGILGAAIAAAKIIRSYSTASVSGTDWVGGIAGGMHVGGTLIDQCYSTGKITITGGNGAGGITAYSDGLVSNCYSTDSIVSTSGARLVAGILGESSAALGSTAQNCFSTAVVIGDTQAAGIVAETSGDMIYNCVALNQSINPLSPGGFPLGHNVASFSNCKIWTSVLLQGIPYSPSDWTFAQATDITNYTSSSKQNWDPAIWCPKSPAAIATSGINANLPILANLDSLPQPPYITACVGELSSVTLASSANSEDAGNVITLTATVTPSNAATPITYDWEIYYQGEWVNMWTTIDENYYSGPVLLEGPNNYRVTARNSCSSARSATITVTGNPPPPGGSAARIAWNPKSGRYIVTYDPNDAGLYFKFGSVIGIFSGSGGVDNTRLSITPNPNNGATFNPSQDIAWTPNTTPIVNWGSINYTHIPNMTIDAAYHTAANVKLGLGDPCRLIGLDLDYIKNTDATLLAQYPSKFDNGIWMTPTQQQNHDFTGYSAPYVSNGGDVCDWWWDATGTTSGSVGGRLVYISPFAGVAGSEFTGAPSAPGIRGSGPVTPQRAAKFLPAVGQRNYIGTIVNQGTDESYYWSDNSDPSGYGIYMSPTSVNLVFSIPAATTDAMAIRCVRYVLSSHTVSFNINGASGTTPPPMTGIEGSQITLPGGGGLTRAGYSFGGWTDGTNTYAGGSSFTIPGSDVVLTAIWAIDYRTMTDGSSSNSFILNPPASGSTKYWIPVTQVNRFWGGNTEGYGNNPANTIGATDTWAVDMIWSEDSYANLFDPTKTSSTTVVTLSKAGGTGSGDYFELSVPAGFSPANFGNFTLGIKKTSGTGQGQYLWSWHFWVTNYNPDAFRGNITISSTTYTYTTSGMNGQVERYAATYNWAAGGAYANSVMMDRNLGYVNDPASMTLPTSTSKGQLYYQYGRKDPFPADVPTLTGLLDNVTKKVSQVAVQSPKSIANSVNTPWIFFHESPITGSPANWASDAQGQYLWNDPQVAEPTASPGKSIYDPCPPGWAVPLYNSWIDFTAGSTVLNPSRNLDHNNGVLYWPGSGARSGLIWYPATASREAVTGAISSGSGSSMGTSGSGWSNYTTANMSAESWYFSFDPGPPPHISFAGSNDMDRSYGYAVRCVSK